MLEEVRITGLGVIDDAVLELSAGFTALTGETGAGKTMVVTALGLLFGGRAIGAGPARRGASRGGGAAAGLPGCGARSRERRGDLDDNGSALRLGRLVSAEGRSRASNTLNWCRQEPDRRETHDLFRS